MKASELRAKDVAGLEKEIADLLKAHFGLRMQRATQQLTNHTQLGNTRRDIARAKTILAAKKKEGAAK
ncbi:MAG: 50S ribosomal protein L29 [Rhizobacter sp.]